ncbi:unnamed protein product [Rotaria sordida]|uniref:Uncharacterized protein n=1 Tax=Rotaria sordida TaxID=392033 RepID=A0A814WGX9_9BILA|nr:unnamed protein product [Rotaria sordida]CAF4137830.1 unnamed protein product [Rotaria sordida]
MIDQFNSSFYFERRWFFSHQHYVEENMGGVIFYSIQPYGRKHYKLYKLSNKDRCSHRQEALHDLVRHVYMEDEESIVFHRVQFLKATELTLWCGCNYSTAVIFHHIICLTQLTNLTINWGVFCFDQLLELLSITLNIQTLKLYSIRLYQSNPISIQQTEFFRLVYNGNKITSLTISHICSLDKYELLVTLCPRLQYMILNISINDLESIIKLLLMKTNANTRHLFSLCLLNATTKMYQILKIMIDSEKLLDNDSIKLAHQKLYLWW